MIRMNMQDNTARAMRSLLALAIALGCRGVLHGAEKGGGDYDIQAAKKVEVVNVDARLTLDAYGGSKSIRGQATGWFAVQKIRDRWWLVTPDGHGMVSLGVVHIMATSTLPIYETAYHRDQTTFVKDVADNLRRWGFNSAGYGAVWKSRDRAMMSEMPVMVSLEDLLGISRFSKTPERMDVFDESARRVLAKRIAQHVEPAKNAKNLIGYFYVDLPLWWNLTARKKGNDWAIAYRMLPAAAPGKAQYVDFVLKRHNSVAAVNQAYGTSAADRAGLLAETFWAKAKPDDPAVRADDKAFVAIVARQYYKVCHDEIRRLDPHHLIFGDRYAGTDLGLLEDVIKAASPYLDGVAIQPFDRERYDAALYDRVAEITGKPVLFCDFAVNFATPQYPHGMWGSWPTEDQAADIWAQYLKDAFAHPYVVGIHRCEYIDLPREKVLKQGLIRQDGRPYVRTVQRYAEIHKELYRAMYGVAAGANNGLKSSTDSARASCRRGCKVATRSPQGRRFGRSPGSRSDCPSNPWRPTAQRAHRTSRCALRNWPIGSTAGHRRDSNVSTPLYPLRIAPSNRPATGLRQRTE